MTSAEGKERVLQHLRTLIRRDECVLSYDFDLIDTLPDILREQFGVRNNEDIGQNQDLSALFSLLRSQYGGAASGIGQLPEMLRSSGVALEEFATRAPEGVAGQEPAKFEHWSTASASEGVEKVLELQKDLGMGRWNAGMQKYEPHRAQTELRGYLRSVTTSRPSIVERISRRHFWELKFAQWKLTGKMDLARRSLSIGPRWVTEIAYFREVVGLRQHIGLDLFSDDSELVVAGDMHAMPFPDQHFGFIFLKNTADKSYSVRKLTEELLRVVEPRGLIVIDQICGYGRCSPLSRTDIQHAKNLLRVFQARAQVVPLVCYDIDISGVGDAREKNETRRVARLAVQVMVPPS